MVSCQPTQKYRVPLKSCRDTIIEHNLVTISLGVEWPERGGDDPNLVIHITNKQPSPPYIHPSQPSLPNTILYHPHPHQDNIGLTYQQQYYHTSSINNHDHLLNSTTGNPISDHNDVLSITTTTNVYNTAPPLIQTSSSSSSSTEIQKIKTDLQSFLPNSRYQPTINQQYLTSQHVIHTPLPPMNDTKKTMINPPASIKPISSIVTQYPELKQSSSSSTIITSPMKPLVCLCPHPTAYHDANCAVSNANNQESTLHLSSDPIHRLAINRSNTQLIPPPLQTPMNNGFTINSVQDLLPSTHFIQVSNSNTKNTSDSSSTLSTIVSQQPSFLNNIQLCSTMKTPSLDPGNVYQQPPPNISPGFPPNQSSYQVNTPMSIPNNEQQNTVPNNTRPRKSILIKRNSDSYQDQALIQSLSNNSQSQIHFTNNQNSPNRTQDTKSPSILTSPIQKQQGIFTLQDNSQITDKSAGTITNDTKINNKQKESPCTTTMVRSPVKLDTTVSEQLNSTIYDIPEVVDQTITEVASGKVRISIGNSSKSAASQQKQPTSPTTTRAHLSPLHQKQQPSTFDANSSPLLIHSNVVEIPSQVIHSNLSDQTKTTTITIKSQPKTKRKQTEPKRPKKSTSNKKQTITLSDTSSTNVNNEHISWVDTSRTLPESIADVSTENANQDLINSSLSLINTGHNDGSMLNYTPFTDQFHMIDSNRDYYDLFPSKLDDPFSSSTPLLPSLDITEPMLNSTSIDKSSCDITTSLSNEVYQDYFPISCDINQSATSDLPNNLLSNQQYYSSTNTFIDTIPQTQTLSSQFNETNSMNNNHDVQTSTKQKQQTKKPGKNLSKSLKQQNRPNKTLSIKLKCTRCRHGQLTDITHHEFPGQKGVVYECTSCGNNSMRSNVSAEERKRRLNKVAQDHLNPVECSFCHKLFHSHSDYLNHLKDDHGSNKP